MSAPWRERLENAGYSHFLDYVAERGIRGGRKWEEVLHRELGLCDAVVAVVTQHSIDSPWCFAELAMTRARGKPIFPVRVSPDLVHPLLKDTQHLDLDSLPSDLEAARLGPHSFFDWDPSQSPYPGLEQFEARHAGVFFGRDREIRRVRERLEGAGQHRFVGVVGPSGSGKSSLVRAGVLPHLAHSSVWRLLRPVTPGTRPLSALARALGDAFVRSGRDRRASAIESSLAAEPRALAEMAHDLLSGSDESRVALLVDQFEEVLTQSETEQRASFLKRLEETLEDLDSPVWVLATLRSEFLTPGLRHPAVARLFAEPLLLGPLDRVRLPQVILGPARRVGLEFEAGLVERMVEETRGGDALPLLAFTLKCLHTAAGETRRVSAKTYEEIGGVEGTLRKRADAVFARAAQAHSRARILEVLLRLVTLDAKSEPARRRQSIEGLDVADLEILRLFADERLLTTDREWDVAYFEVAHEALLRVWPPLREAILARGDDLRLRADLERAADDWQQAGRNESYLWFGERVRTVSPLLKKRPTEPLIAAFVEAVVARQANLLANRILNDYRQNPERGMLLALAGADDYMLTPRLRFALDTSWRWSLAEPPGPVTLRHGKRYFKAVAFSRDGSRVMAAATVLEVWDVRKRELISVTELSYTHGPAAFAHNGSRVATPTRIHLLEDPATSVDIGRITGKAIALSADGTLFASAGYTWIEVLDAASGEQLCLLGRHDDEEGDTYCDVAFSPDGSRIVSGSFRGGRCALWNAHTGEKIHALKKGRFVAYSPDGTRVATAQGASAFLWDATDGTLIAELSGHARQARALAFSDDATLLAVATRAGNVRIWDVAASESIAELPGHALALAFSPCGTLLAGTGGSGEIRLWDVLGEHDLRTRAWAQVYRELTDAERAEYLAPAGLTPAEAGSPKTLVD